MVIDAKNCNRFLDERCDEPEIGDIVVLKEGNMPPAKWLLGKIIKKIYR